MLNNVLEDAQTRVQPPTDKGKRLKIYYMTQVGVKPPHFVIFCNDKKLFQFPYQRYLENQLRSVFGLEAVSYTHLMLADAPPPEEALAAFLKFVDGRPLAAHNAEFDIG